MKKLFILTVILFVMVQLSPASAQKHKFYYYPGSNVYYDVSAKQYIYFNGSNWVTVRTLPASIKASQSNRAIVYHTGKNVWIGNAAHSKKYKARKARPTKAKAKLHS
jgi:hypothetical protein